MITTSAAQFRKDNTILQQYGILEGYGILDTGGRTTIDNDGDGVADPMGGDTQLDIDWDTLKEYANRHKTEVITQRDVNEITAMRVTGVDCSGWRDGRPDEISAFKHVPLTSLVRDYEPLEKDAQWAIDVPDKQFLIFSPHA